MPISPQKRVTHSSRVVIKYVTAARLTCGLSTFGQQNLLWLHCRAVNQQTTALAYCSHSPAPLGAYLPTRYTAKFGFLVVIHYVDNVVLSA